MFHIPIDDLKQIILKKDEAIQNFLMEINKYKHINVQTLQSQVQDSVENEETHEESQGQANHELRKASPPPGFAAPDPSTGPETPTEEILAIHIGVTLRTNLLMNVLQTSDVKVTASIQPVAKLNLKI